MNLIYQSLDKFASKGKIGEEAVAKIKESGITTYTSIAEAVKDAQFIVEAVPKRMDIKNSTLAQISAACSPDRTIRSLLTLRSRATSISMWAVMPTVLP